MADIDYSDDPAYQEYVKSGSKLPFPQWYNQTQKRFIPGVQASLQSLAPPPPNQSVVPPVSSYMSPLPNYNVNVQTPNYMFQTNPYSIIGAFQNSIGGQGTGRQNQEYVSPLGMYNPAGGTEFYQ